MIKAPFCSWSGARSDCRSILTSAAWQFRCSDRHCTPVPNTVPELAWPWSFANADGPADAIHQGRAFLDRATSATTQKSGPRPQRRGPGGCNVTPVGFAALTNSSSAEDREELRNQRSKAEKGGRCGRAGDKVKLGRRVAAAQERVARFLEFRGLTVVSRVPVISRAGGLRPSA